MRKSVKTVRRWFTEVAHLPITPVCQPVANHALAERPALTTRSVVTCLVVVLACAVLPANAKKQEDAEEVPSVEDILTNTTPDDEYVKQRRCIDYSRIRHMDVLDKDHILVTERSKKYWVNRLRGKCLGLHRDGIITTEPTGRQLCDMDSIETRDRFSDFPTRCRLGKWESLSHEQAMALKETTKRKPRRKRDRDKDRDGTKQVEKAREAEKRQEARDAEKPTES